jgi:8-oxo-dGTP pyrophosphatase MutT (NUDIX family)
MWHPDEKQVFEARTLDLRVTDGHWPFAEHHSEAIEAHWQERLSETPSFFNGVVHLLTAYSVSPDGLLSARFVRSDFKSFLYWRETGWPDMTVMDAFGSALIFSAEGHVLLGRQSAGNLNSGLLYPPGGFIDARDVGPDGLIDLEASVAREITEETGLAAPAIERHGGYLIALAGPVLSIGVRYRSPLNDGELVETARAYIAADAESELADFAMAPRDGHGRELAMPDYARALLDYLSHAKTCI